MLDAKEIAAAIAQLEYLDSSYSNYAKLADLYIIRDKMEGKEKPLAYERLYSAAPAVVAEEVTGDSDFLRAVSGKDQQSAWDVMDELMDSLKVVNARLYDSTLRKIERL